MMTWCGWHSIYKMDTKNLSGDIIQLHQNHNHAIKPNPNQSNTTNKILNLNKEIHILQKRKQLDMIKTIPKQNLQFQLIRTTHNNPSPIKLRTVHQNMHNSMRNLANSTKKLKESHQNNALPDKGKYKSLALKNNFLSPKVPTNTRFNIS